MRLVGVWAGLAFGAPAFAWTTVQEEDFACSDRAALADTWGTWGWIHAWSGDPWTTDGTDGIAPTTDQSLGSFGYPPDDFENFVITGHPLWEDTSLEATFQATDDDAAGLVTRVVDGGTYYACWTTNDLLPGCAGPVWRPGAWLTRVDTTVACADDYVVAGVSTGTHPLFADVRIRLEAVGSQVTCEIDLDGDGLFGGASDVTLSWVDPAPIGAGGVGLAAFDNAGVAFDDLLIETNDPDADLDGVPDGVEVVVGTDTLAPDTDADGIADGVELGIQAFPFDTDGDYVIDALDTDADGDGISDWIEGGLAEPPPNTDCASGVGADDLPDYRDVDSDGDYFNDDLDLCRLQLNSNVDADGDGLAPECDPDDSASDLDLDGIVDGDEVNVFATDPALADTDGGGIGDGTEVYVDGTDPLDGSDDVTYDTDNDGLDDPREGDWGTDPLDPDSDADGLLDGTEVYETGTDPTSPDTDADGLLDGDEASTGTDPLVSDTDGDGLVDGDELALGGDPLDPDTDADGLTDGEEVLLHGTDPAAADTDGDGLRDGVEIDLGGDPNAPDDDGDNVPTTVEDRNADGDPTNDDTDEDGTADWLDPDDDGDGVPTVDEDYDGNGDPTDDDLDGDGTPSYLQADEIDLEADSDADGLTNVVEAEIGSDPGAADTDDDGLEDGVEVGDPSDPTDTDGDGVPDLLDDDDDGDGLLTEDELDDGAFPRDSDGDGLDDHLDPDSDDDMVLDGVDPHPHDAGGGEPTVAPSAPDHGFGLGCDSVGAAGYGWWLLIPLLARRRRAG